MSVVYIRYVDVLLCKLPNNCFCLVVLGALRDIFVLFRDKAATYLVRHHLLHSHLLINFILG